VVSFVQRCGRCGRERTDNPVQIHWLDYTWDWKPNPYSDADCEDTRNRLLKLTDASLHTLPNSLPDLKLPRYLLTNRDVETSSARIARTGITSTLSQQYMCGLLIPLLSPSCGLLNLHNDCHIKSLCARFLESWKTFCQSCRITPGFGRELGGVDTHMAIL